ncbi:DUF6634 family protein [Aureimonas leprariae]|uniref:DUF6634 family protein n=1 Tax=Plantimonas leprariae TaxID=2615207 RepID=UPI0013874178|nr:DUF6634 family protein [Aureimonas leprariae]
MTILVPPFGEPQQLREELERLRRLVADVEALADGRHPSAAILDDAPIVEDWALALRSAPCLTGQFQGHPSIRNGQPGVTSDLWVLAPSHGYARTLSRFYRLGHAAGTDRGALQ